jgi:hypothetical protein
MKFLFLVVPFCLGMAACGQTAPIPPEAKADPVKVRDAAVFRLAQDAVRVSLKAPATATLSPRSESRVLILDSLAVVTGWVDAQNSFGAKLRGSYRCTMNADADGKWSKADCDIGDRNQWLIEPNQPGQNQTPIKP